MKSQQEYADELAELLEVNKNFELSDDFLSVVIEISQMFTEHGVYEAFNQIQDGADPTATLITIPTFAPVMMFKLGILYGRREAAELLTSE
jgi:hypothetical protein